MIGHRHRGDLPVLLNTARRALRVTAIAAVAAAPIQLIADIDATTSSLSTTNRRTTVDSRAAFLSHLI